MDDIGKNMQFAKEVHIKMRLAEANILTGQIR